MCMQDLIGNATGVHKDRESVMVMLDMKRRCFSELVCTSTARLGMYDNEDSEIISSLLSQLQKSE